LFEVNDEAEEESEIYCTGDDVIGVSPANPDTFFAGIFETAVNLLL
jgi:hypothetical protein